MHIKTSLYVPPKSRSFITSVSFYDILTLWIFILECRPMVTWYILPRIWLCSLFVHLDPEKHFNSFLLLYIGFYYAWKWLWKISIYTKAFLTKIHIRMHVCTKKVFLALISLHLLYIKLKLESFLLFYAYRECTTECMHRMEICAKKLCWVRTKDSILIEAEEYSQKKVKHIYIGLCKLHICCAAFYLW